MDLPPAGSDGSVTDMKALRTLLLLFLALPVLGAQTPTLQKHPQYSILPGDVLEIHYRYSPSFDQTVTVQPDGFINLNLVGNIHIAGMTVDHVHDTILKSVAERLNDPEITIVLREFHKPFAVVSGEVAKPGKVDLQEGSTALAAIMLAGGWTENARAGQVILFRKVNNDLAEVHILKLGKLDKTQYLENDMPLQSGDMIMVPRDRISRISRFIKLANVGVYMNPLDRIP